jgi:hypothetical protein
MRKVLYAFAAVAVLAAPAAAGAHESKRDDKGELKTYTLYVCDKGAFRADAWNREYGRVQFIIPDALRNEGTIDQSGKACITEEQLAKLKSMQSEKLQVVDRRGQQ